jgi:hypothetical protein
VFFRSYKLIAACRRSKAFAAILVPAFLLGTLPHSACICADGHKEPSCNATACCAMASGKATDGCCGCTCCKPGDDGKPRACCQANHRSKTADQKPASGLAAKTGHCCSPIVEAPAPAAAAKKVEPQAHKHLLTAVLPALQSMSALPVPATTRPLDNHHGPPPLDAVIVYLHLTI